MTTTIVIYLFLKVFLLGFFSAKLTSLIVKNLNSKSNCCPGFKITSLCAVMRFQAGGLETLF